MSTAPHCPQMIFYNINSPSQTVPYFSSVKRKIVYHLLVCDSDARWQVSSSTAENSAPAQIRLQNGDRPERVVNGRIAYCWRVVNGRFAYCWRVVNGRIVYCCPIPVDTETRDQPVRSHRTSTFVMELGCSLPSPQKPKTLLLSLARRFFFYPMPPHVFVDFVVFPPGHGRSVTDF